MQELVKRSAELVQANGRLQLQIAELSAPGRVQREARRLGYRMPDPDEVQTIVQGRHP
jgi:cell division protein FtsL